MEELKLLDTFMEALAARPAPIPETTELTVGQHRYHIVTGGGDDPLGDKLAELREAGLKVLDYKRRFGGRWVVKTMVPRE